jgi:hypothetical protein
MQSNESVINTQYGKIPLAEIQMLINQCVFLIVGWEVLPDSIIYH